MNHRSLIGLLEHLSPFSPDSPPEHEESSASASLHALGEVAPFALTSTGHVVVKTELCIEREMLPEMYTHYQRRQQGGDTGSGDFDDLSRILAVDDPVQLQRGHIFDRKYLRSW